MRKKFYRNLFDLQIKEGDSSPICTYPGCGKPAHNIGYDNFRSKCYHHHSKKYEMSNWNYKKYRKNHCDNIDGRFGFDCTATIHNVNYQLTIDHINGNHCDNSPSNLQTLCHNCHHWWTFTMGYNLKKEFRILTEERRILLENVLEINLKTFVRDIDTTLEKFI